MEKGTGKGALEKKATPLFEKTFIYFSYRMVIDVQDNWFLRVLSKICRKRSFFLYNFVKHSWSCGLSLICKCFSYVFTTGFFFFGAVFHNIYAPHRWGGVWINNNYQVLNNNLNAKKIQYSVTSSYILLCHTDHYNVYRELINVTHWRMTVSGKI